MTKSKRTKMLMSACATLFFFIAVVGAEHEVEDFEFADTDDGISIVKRAAVYLDDEDFQADEQGSTPDTGYEGSGSTTPETFITRGPHVEDYPRFFRVKVTFSNLTYTDRLADRNSEEFKQQSQILESEIARLFSGIQGQQTVTILQYSANDHGGATVTFDLGHEGFASEGELKRVLEASISSGRIGRDAVSSYEFAFRSLDASTQTGRICQLDELLCAQNQVCIPRVRACNGIFDCADGKDEEFCSEVQCPVYVGRSPEFLPQNGTNIAYLLINNAFPCDGMVVAWEYYRQIPRGSAFVGVWRQSGDAEFVLIAKTELPPAPSGKTTVQVDDPIHVQRGDFIGIFYPRSATINVNVIAQTTSADDVEDIELYQTYNAQFYDDMVQEGIPFDLNTVSYISTNTTFAIRALMNYEGRRTDDAYTCKPNEFSCGDLYCIDAEYVCDGQDDCNNGFDEQNCLATVGPCPEGSFRCTDGKCISRTLLCDGKPDCSDGSDERCFNCSEDEYTCKTGECIAQFLRCNKENDCKDGSDEDGCGVSVCGPNDYQCIDGTCISLSLRCNSRPDCQGGDDEFGCSSKPCASGEFRCEYGKCIPLVQRCDQVYHCPDRSDELDCPCSEDQFTCQNGECIPKIRLCDAQPDCSDNSDEDRELCLPTIPTFPPACPDGYFRCALGICIESYKRCNDISDCPDGSDESECVEHRCQEGEFRCNNGRCIDASLQCDGIPDCEDQSDESHCIQTCGPHEFTCGSGQCIDLRRKCDSYPDCQDQSDEIGCSRCKRNEFECNDGTCIDRRSKCDRSAQCPDSSDEFNCTCNVAEFRCQNGQCIPQHAFCDQRQDCIDGTDESNCSQPCKEDQFTCENGECIDRRRFCDGRADCRDRSDEENCPQPCKEDQFTCENGECIDRRRFCDGRADCRDRSDEENCPQPCKEDQFTCENGECIDRRRFCDGRADCRDRSDEENCPGTCRTDEFTCGNGQCIDRRRTCDSRADCRDGSDEENCLQVCREDQFTCGNGDCIDRRRTCDGRSDCQDRSDEQNCPVPPSFQCMPGQFRCATGQCIDAGFKCDRQIDCLDRSDETSCPTSRRCPESQFQCDSGHCLDMRRRCDGRKDCPQGSDEVGCPTCSPVQFTCSNGQCISSHQRCDRKSDCQDGSDERSCPCGAGEFTCVSDGRCLPPGYRCNGNPDCRDGSDEQNCVPGTCAEGQFRCRSGQCVDLFLVCDNIADCSDNTDEEDCEVPCHINEFRCLDGQCIPLDGHCNGRTECRDLSDEQNCACSDREFRCSDGKCVPQAARCNRRYDCQDGSDERDCAQDITITISPQQMRKRVGTSASFICQVTGSPPPRVVWSRRTGGAMPSQAVDANGRLTIVNLQREDAGDYLCQAISPGGTFEAVARLDVDFIGPVTDIPITGGPCSRDEATCSNGQCIPRDYLCDGESDCSDDSDENNCILALHCEPNEFRCNNGHCALKIWRCDGDNDCKDNSDESSCPTRIPGAPCQTDEFKCRTYDQCVPLAYQCDGELDCQDRSDEIGCTQPSIVTPPVPEISVEINGSFTIICEAVGMPTPLIVWRLNWGNIPPGDRVTVTSVDGRGTLVVRNVVPEDAGAYTCEAINNRGSIFAIPDALIIVRRTVGVCSAPKFNADASSPEQCIRCFCYGQTQTCYSSNLQISQITLGNSVALVRRTNLEPIEQGFIHYIPASREFEVKDFNNVLRSGSYYWLLPYQYLSKRLSSYGGELTYKVYYEVDGFDDPTDDIDVIISGNGITLYHRSQAGLRPRTQTTVKVPLVETVWERSRDSPRGGLISEYATREDLMQVLENVTTIQIRATYDKRQTLVRLGSVLLTTGVIQITGLGRAVNVEECTCPTGYSGYSCEECASGFYRVERGIYGRECIACSCNGYSNDCDPRSGICRNCRDNTAGPYCNECAEGYVGDPHRGKRCQACPCPLTTPDNQFSSSCILDRNGEIECTACPEGYTGKQCEKCASGYRGNPLTPGDRCIRAGEIVCDQRGSLTSLPDLVSQQCRCKKNVEGQYCNRCKPNTFYLSGDYPNGCLTCFCTGVTQTCQSTTWNRAQISLSFTQSSDVVLTDMMQQKSISQGLTVDRQTRELVFRGFSNVDKSIRYWSLPQQFLGDKVISYGGFLRFTVRYRAGRNNRQVNQNDPVVEIGGNDITLVHRLTDLGPRENEQTSFAVPFIETHWNRMDGMQTTREHLLMALADLNFILIRATYTVDTEESAISSISLDVAESRNTGQERANPVEQCACPRGYKGLSCEDCDTGYTRTGGGLYLGLCKPCQCNGHSSECDPRTGICRNCHHNTEGNHCEYCSRGYYGNATRGSVFDCQKCPCPLTDSPNQFSQECILGTDGRVTCTACPIGHTGRQCERCVSGYQGNPKKPGDYCKLVNVTCDCDERGTVPNTLCDPNTQLCQCKNNVQGRRCSACKEGYFYLSSENEMGCLRCFCSGVSNQCSSSNYYRDEIVPMLNSDGTHNFHLTNQRLTHIISDGFTMNAERNEISFNNFEGIQREQESLFFSLPPKFRGDKVSSYGGYLRFGLLYTSYAAGRDYMDVVVQIISKQDKQFYYLHRQTPKARELYSYDILLTENSFRNQKDGQTPSRETFLSALADIEAILIRATYHTAMDTVTLRDLRMEIAIPTITGKEGTPEVERCNCPEGYTGLSCQLCAAGYLRVKESGTGVAKCVRCNCNGHSTSCDPETGVCQNCQDNTVGDRCELCAPGYYGDATAGTISDCRVCACPLTLPSNQFSPTCVLSRDSRVTCDRCAPGYTGRDCGQCAAGYQGSPNEPGGRCERTTVVDPRVIVHPVSLTEPLGATASFQCTPGGRAPYNVVWSRIDGRPLPRRATQGPGPNYLLTITNLEYADSARYVCQVTNAVGTVRDSVTLTVEHPGPSLRVRIEEPSTIVTRPGQTAGFTCIAYQYSRAANYVLSWTKDGGTLPTKASDQNGILVIPLLTENDVGTYTCTGSDPASVDRATATISFGDVEEPPSVRIEPRYLQVSVGDKVEFQCIAEGSPKPTVTWKKGRDEPLQDYTYTDETGKFRIASVSINDQAEYWCTAVNSEGSASVRTIIYVQQRSQFEVVIRRTNITAVIGHNEQLVCYVNGGNGVTLTWSKEGGLPIGATQENGILTLPNIQQSHAGTYTCTGISATGIVGRATSRITVTGTPYKAPTVRIEPDRQTVRSGTTGSLHCIVTGEPQPTITWSKPNGQLSSNHQVSGEFLRILQATMDDRGIYVCSATNVAGTDQASAIVDVERREPPKIEIFPSGLQTKTRGSSAVLQCRIVGGIPSPVVTWSRAFNRNFTNRTEVKLDMGVITFNSLTSEEQGEYICSATNEVGTVTNTSSLRVEGPPTIEITPSNRITSIVGDRVNIECVGIGDPTPAIIWKSPQKRRSDILPETFDMGSSSARLLFESIQKSDEGQYICIATNEEGKTEETVHISVLEHDDHDDRPGVSIDGPEQVSKITGQSLELRCSSKGLSNPRFRWRRPGNQPLPPGHSVTNGVLYTPRIEPEDAGEYICSVVSESVGTEFLVSVYIIVNGMPKLSVTPSRLTSHSGQSVQLHCQASGQGPFSIEWSKLDGQLSPQARDSNGVLDIRQVTRADSGRYRCVGRNAAGITEAFADVIVLTPPVVTVTPEYSEAAHGGTVEIRCQVQGDPLPIIQWERENGPLPLQHQIRDGVLRIYNAQPSDSDRYICRASNGAGTASDYGILTVHEVEHGPGIYRANVNDRVELECEPTENVSIKWTKLEGPLPHSATTGQGVLIIYNVQEEDAGTYLCTAYNEFGAVRSKFQLVVSSRPVILNQQEYVTAAMGQPARLSCVASGYPPPTVTWVKKEGDLPVNHLLEKSGDLVIPKVIKNDSGIYNCIAKNENGVTVHPLIFIVTAFVPHFKQAQTSYLSFPPLDDVYNSMDITLSFRPEATDGLLLYNGQYKRPNGDFVCFGLEEQYPEFRFDLGSGPTVIRGTKPLELNRWHTVHLQRYKKSGTMLVNDEPAYYGESGGNFEGLDLAEPLYIGNVPDIKTIPLSARFTTGFVGAVSEIKVKNTSYDIGSQVQMVASVDHYPVCHERPCENGGLCLSHNSKFGFTCDCTKGFTGLRCELSGERCYRGACGTKGRCFNWPTVTGFGCICPARYRGEWCEQNFTFVYPAFNKTSFISYPTISDGLVSVHIELTFKVNSLDDGIVLYNAQRQDGRHDFIAIIIRDHYLELRFDTGSGPAILRSRQPLELDYWITVIADRKGRDGMLIVNDELPVNEQVGPNDGLLFSRLDRGDIIRGTASGNKTIGLNLDRPLYLGGIDPFETISPNAGVQNGFVGCVAVLKVGDKPINLFKEALSNLNIGDCGDESLCQRKLCQNFATCIDISPTEYRCICNAQFTGINCETRITACISEQPCQNGGTCVALGLDYRCDCPPPWIGRNCDHRLELSTSVQLNGDGYVELSKILLPHPAKSEREIISFTITTTTPNGLLFWQGQQPGEQELEQKQKTTKDYLALALNKGYVEFRFELGSGPALVRSVVKVDDGYPHSVIIERHDRNGSVIVDNKNPVHGLSQGGLKLLTLTGNLFFGGVPDLNRHTGNLFTSSFVGCLQDLKVQNKLVDFGKDTIRRSNVHPCSTN